MTSSMMGPLSMFSGGLLRNRCALNAIENDLKKDPATSEGAAARIKADEAAAAARRQAVRYLGTVDCNYWPDAIDALSNSLRKDPNECVRFEAALALRNGCCCQEKTIKALMHCVEQSNKDGAPIERSDRVRAAAADALARCPIIPKEDGGIKDGEIKKAQAAEPNTNYAHMIPGDHTVNTARGLLVGLDGERAQPIVPVNPRIPTVVVQQRPHSLGAIMSSAMAVETLPGGTRQPFFTNLTKALTGKQDNMVVVRQETPPPPAAIATIPVPMPAGPVTIPEATLTPVDFPPSENEAVRNRLKEIVEIPVPKETATPPARETLPIPVPEKNVIPVREVVSPPVHEILPIPVPEKNVIPVREVVSPPVKEPLPIPVRAPEKIAIPVPEVAPPAIREMPVPRQPEVKAPAFEVVSPTPPNVNLNPVGSKVIPSRENPGSQKSDGKTPILLEFVPPTPQAGVPPIQAPTNASRPTTNSIPARGVVTVEIPVGGLLPELETPSKK
jgi:hypothetical protein